MRLIDADALSEKLCETTIFIKDGEVFQRMINDAPTIDAVEVVRCKECKYWHSNTEFCDVWSFANIAQRTLADDYCNRGERREDDKA